MHKDIVSSGVAIPVSGLSDTQRAKQTIHELKFIEAVIREIPDTYSIAAVGEELLREVPVELIPNVVSERFENRKKFIKETLAHEADQRTKRLESRIEPSNISDIPLISPNEDRVTSDTDETHLTEIHENKSLSPRAQAFRNLKNLAGALIGVVMFGLIPALLLAGSFLFYLNLQGADWQSQTTAIIVAVGCGLSALSAIFISIISILRQMDGTTGKGFSTWTEDAAGLSLKQYGIFLILFR